MSGSAKCDSTIERAIRTTGLAVVTEVGEENTSDTTVGQTEVSKDMVNDERTYGAAIEVPEMVLVEVLESIQAEVTSTPRNQTGSVSGRAVIWCDERRRTIEGFTKIGEIGLNLPRVNCPWSNYIGIVIKR